MWVKEMKEEENNYKASMDPLLVGLQAGQQAVTWACVALGVSVIIIPDPVWTAAALCIILLMAGLGLTATWIAQRSIILHLVDRLGEESDSVNHQLLATVVMISILPKDKMEPFMPMVSELFSLADCSQILGKEHAETPDEMAKIINMVARKEVRLKKPTWEILSIAPPEVALTKAMTFEKV